MRCSFWRTCRRAIPVHPRSRRWRGAAGRRSRDASTAVRDEQQKADAALQKLEALRRWSTACCASGRGAVVVQVAAAGAVGVVAAVAAGGGQLIAGKGDNTMVPGDILLVDDDPDLLKLISLRLTSAGYRVRTAESGETALAAIAASRPDVVLSDLRMSGMDGMALFQEIQASLPGLPVIILTAHGTIPDAVTAVKRGVFGYLTKPYDADELLGQIERALTLHGGAGRCRPAGGRLARGHRDALLLMEDLLAKAQRVAARDASVLIHGESGTGKELLARAIHRAQPAREPARSSRSTAARIPETLLESELFGHDQGRVHRRRSPTHRGLFASADGGTLFLDEIGDMPLALQVKLLRVLEDGRGARRRRHAHDPRRRARHLAPRTATSTRWKDDRRVPRGPLLPPQRGGARSCRRSRERREDIALLARHFLESMARATAATRPRSPPRPSSSWARRSGRATSASSTTWSSSRSRSAPRRSFPPSSSSRRSRSRCTR